MFEIKIVTAQEMARVESLGLGDGNTEQRFMENAGRSVAEITEDFVESNSLPRKVSLIAGKGNNGGDGFAAGLALLDRGFTVTAWHIYPSSSCTPLCQQMRQRFEKKGGLIHAVTAEKSFDFKPEGVILDALVGTGFKGKAEGILALAIERTNHAHLPIIAIDIPSGVNGTSGAVESVAIKATKTVYLELPKIGFFVKEGWDYTGELVRGVFGLQDKYKEKAKAVAHLFNTDALGHLLPPIKRTRHKYEAGYVLAFAGSKEMPGAAILSSFSALLSGAGIVRLFHPKDMRAELSSAPYELIKEEWDGKTLSRIKMESKRAKAALIGPGMGRTKSAEQAIKTLLKHLDLPTVLDADALHFLSKNPKCALPEQTILTPHHGEMQMLLSSFKTKAADPVAAFAAHKKATIVLKGAPTFIYTQEALPLIIARGNPGMATAGSGDVLTGILAAMLAQGLRTKTAACVAASLHAIAGEIAAAHLTPYCMTASSLMEFLPDAFNQFILEP